MDILSKQGIDKVTIISHPSRKKEKEKLINALERESLISRDRICTQKAILGAELPPPDCWKGSAGAWGRILSHSAAIQEAYGEGVNNLLILEDDALLKEGCASYLSDFLEQVPVSVSLTHLGGRHCGEPKRHFPGGVISKGVETTQGYIIKRSLMSYFLQHILYFPDYKDNEWSLGKQIRNASTRGNWEVAAPRWSIIGEQSGKSTITGITSNRENWWCLCIDDQYRDLPLAAIKKGISIEGYESKLYTGFLNNDSILRSTKGMIGLATNQISTLAGEAFSYMAIPALWYESEEELKFIIRMWFSEVRVIDSQESVKELSEFDYSKDQQLACYE